LSAIIKIMIHLAARGKEKIGLISRETDSQWVSCLHINQGLRQAYEMAGDVKHFKLYNSTSALVVSGILDSDIGCLVFYDHQVRPIEILKDERLQTHIKNKNIRVILHVYGCFLDRMAEYHEILTLLAGCDVHFIASSPKQKKIVECVLQSPGRSVHLVPFPMWKTIKSKDQGRAEMRKELGISDSAQLFLYTGRISTFKNVELVMTLLNKARVINPKIIFMYVGSFDNFDSFKANDKYSNQATINAKLLNQIDPHAEWCFYKPFVKAEELSRYYLAADAFISLSVCRGEDFGMSVLEASSFGLPCFLTDWAGYSGFSELPDTYLAPVILDGRDMKITLDEMEKRISRFVPSSSEQKKAKMIKVEQDFSIEKTMERIKEILEVAKTYPKGFKTDLIIRRELLRRVDSFDIINELQEVYEIYSSKS
jgi:glycosyltransferase involved in cell wall biosynthesis